MNSYFASQLIADRQAAVAADVAHRAQLKEARAARRAVAAAASAGRPARTRRLLLGRLAHAGA
jgi:hypothetical protein